MIYEIHEYKESDVPWLRSLWLEAFGDEPSLTDTFFELLPSMGVGLVAEFYGELFGAAYVLYTELHSPGRPPKKIAYIYGVAVDKQAQGQGIGAELLAYATDELGVTWLWALEQNVRGQAFYRRHGFELTGEKLIEDEWVPLLKMALGKDK